MLPSLLQVARRCCLIGCLAIVYGQNIQADEASRAAAFRDQLQPLLKTYCFECHGIDKPEGEVSLEKYKTIEEISKDRKEWLRVLKQVQLGTMPPEVQSRWTLAPAIGL